MTNKSILNDIRNLALSLQIMDKTYNDYAKSINHTYTELQIINLISEIKMCTQKKIVDASFLPKQTVNNTINKLVALGIVTKNESEHKNKLITLSDFGKSYAKDSLDIIRNIEINAMHSLSAEERSILVVSLSKYACKFNELLTTRKGGKNDKEI